MDLTELGSHIATHPTNLWAAELGWKPVYAVTPASRIVVVGQAPGERAQHSGVPWTTPAG